ncbi:MAG: outer membrane lipoprotein LolB [Gammaproteobacteria bacterium]|nr:MAG: outer membrane lipoprotein LolB [Gammaproteobacteria bacterium]
MNLVHRVPKKVYSQTLLIFTVITSLVLTGCMSAPKVELKKMTAQQRQQQLNNIDMWTLTGRLAIRTADEANSLSFNWQHKPEQQLLLLYGTFGNTYAKLHQSAELATLELADNKVYQSHKVEDLLLNVLGYPLPIDHLNYWVRGLPYPGEQSVLTYNSLGYLKSIRYQQWTISFKRYQYFDGFNKLSLPKQITVTDGQVTLKFSIRKWILGTKL